jgi:hypothetical protein
VKVVIQCSGTKNPRAGTFQESGRRVGFVAHPELVVGTGHTSYARPDDLINDAQQTWRDRLISYNRDGHNADELLTAASLYSPPVYKALAEAVGMGNMYILSAGWGLVRSSYLLPDYDITFSMQAKPWQRRRQSDAFSDFNHLAADGVVPQDVVYFFGGRDYLPLYYRLTRNIPARKVVYVAAASIPRESTYEYIEYGSKGTNWHYRCASDFVGDRIAK